jgi:solute carrier family 25 phosphate transporter 23/24/25/41
MSSENSNTGKDGSTSTSLPNPFKSLADKEFKTKEFGKNLEHAIDPNSRKASESTSPRPSLLESRLSDQPSSYVPPSSLRGPPPPDLFHSSPDAGPSNSRRSRASLADFRRTEGPSVRAAKLHALWSSLPNLPAPTRGPTPTSLMHLPGQGTVGTLSPERVERLRRLYEEELSRRISLEEREGARLWGGADDLPDPNAQSTITSATSSNSVSPNTSVAASTTGKKGIKWKDFRKFLWDQEEQLWEIFCDLDVDGDGRLDQRDLRGALGRSGR